MLDGKNQGGTGMLDRIGQRIALGRAIRADARQIVDRRRRQAEAAAWIRARDPHLTEEERFFREAVAARVSRMFAFVGIDKQH